MHMFFIFWFYSHRERLRKEDEDKQCPSSHTESRHCVTVSDPSCEIRETLMALEMVTVTLSEDELPGALVRTSSSGYGRGHEHTFN